MLEHAIETPWVNGTEIHDDFWGVAFWCAIFCPYYGPGEFHPLRLRICLSQSRTNSDSTRDLRVDFWDTPYGPREFHPLRLRICPSQSHNNSDSYFAAGTPVDVEPGGCWTRVHSGHELVWVIDRLELWCDVMTFCSFPISWWLFDMRSFKHNHLMITTIGNHHITWYIQLFWIMRCL